MGFIKRIERFGRWALVAALAYLCARRRRPVDVGPAPRMLVIRLDERVGNLIMLTPLLRTLKLRFPQGQLHLLGYARGARLLSHHPCVDRYLRFRKWGLFSVDGPFSRLWQLRRQRYDLVIDAANPTDPSTTQAILARFSGGRHTVGPAHAAFARMYSAPATIDGHGPHEIDLRLALLTPVPGTDCIRSVELPPPPTPHASTPTGQRLRTMAATPFGIVNAGARLANKTLTPESYAKLCDRMAGANLLPVVTFGPAERELAERICTLSPNARLAPPTTLEELAAFMRSARAVISCDTGPMHLAVAMGAPTLSLFVDTEPERYGYDAAPHSVLDIRQGLTTAHLDHVHRWLAASCQKDENPSSAAQPTAGLCHGASLDTQPSEANRNEEREFASD